MKKIIASVFFITIMSSSVIFAEIKKNDNSSIITSEKTICNPANETVCIENATPVRTEAGWVIADEWNMETREWTGEKRLLVWYNRNGYYEIKGQIGNTYYRVQRSNKGGYKYMCEFWKYMYYFNSNDF